MEEKDNKETSSIHIDGLLMRMACRAAVRACQDLTKEEALALIQDLTQNESPATCPHGRPLARLIPMRDMERMFGR
jgi:DNA mismatch repair protein MutL